MAERLARKVLLIGWDAADWKVIHPLIDAGLMPTLEKFINNGVMGNLATLDPPLSPIMWTSIGTGKTADKPGILGFVQPRADGASVQPVLSTSRKVKALWNILMQEGFRTHVIGWWPSHPAEKINGVCISNFYHHATSPSAKEWKMAPGTVHPEHLAETLAELRIHPTELTPEHILPFVPTAKQVDQDKDKRLFSVAKVTAECASIHAAATWVMENEPWDLMAVYFDAIDHYCHGFMKFHPPYRQGIPKDLYDHYKDVVSSGYRFHDMMLERMLQLAGADTTVIICSDHGFHPDHLRPLAIPKEPAGPAAEHRHYGMIAMQGPGIKKDQLIYGASLLDVTPTILTLFGLPVGRDMDGKPLVQAFDREIQPAVIDSWETVDGDSGMHAGEQVSDPWADQEVLNQLVALGYIEPPGEDAQKNVEKTVRETKYYLARVYLHKNDYHSALPLLEEIYENAPDQSRYALRLAHCYQALKRFVDCRRVVDDITARQQEKVRELEQAWQKKIDEGKGEGRGKGEQAPPMPRHPINLSSLDLLQGNLLLAEDKPDEAMTFLQRAQQASPRLPNLHLQIGHAYLKRRRLQDAEKAFFQALDIDGDSAAAYHGLARVYLQMKQFQDAAEVAMQSVGLIYHNPTAHYHLGEALYRLGRFELAAQSWEVCVTQAPGMQKAHEKLINLYRHFLNDVIKAEEHRRFIRERIVPNRKGAKSEDEDKLPAEAPQPVEIPHPQAQNSGAVITVVSGLPRSGTSMMMQMLEAGGMGLLVDEQRLADASNLRGYFEYEAVKKLRNRDCNEASWLPDAQGKAVKIIAQLLTSLPKEYHYRILFMQRDLQEILQSQQTMLENLGKSAGKRAVLEKTFRQQLAKIQTWLAQQDNIEVLYVQHREVLSNPLEQVERINGWLGGVLEIEKSAAVVDVSLYHAKTPL